jgi:hypothetical protein
MKIKKHIWSQPSQPRLSKAMAHEKIKVASTSNTRKKIATR